MSVTKDAIAYNGITSGVVLEELQRSSQALCECRVSVRVLFVVHLHTFLIDTVFGCCKGALDHCILVVVHQVLEIVDFFALLFVVDLLFRNILEILQGRQEVRHDHHVDLM